jgi:hypothetical protein
MKTEAARTAQARTAQMIRKELKVTFPNVKFSVRSSSYSMGDNVNVEWTDGVVRSEVEALLAKYQYGSFDGMTDSYNNDNMREDIPQTKYLFCTRNASDATKAMIENYINNKFDFSNMDPWSEKQLKSTEFTREFKNCAYPEQIHENEIAA